MFVDSCRKDEKHEMGAVCSMQWKYDKPSKYISEKRENGKK